MILHPINVKKHVHNFVFHNYICLCISSDSKCQIYHSEKKKKVVGTQTFVQNCNCKLKRFTFVTRTNNELLFLRVYIDKKCSWVINYWLFHVFVCQYMCFCVCISTKHVFMRKYTKNVEGSKML